jgi:malate dehydrogenase (oxaloacetate-decarboxylating)(NADP+)
VREAVAVLDGRGVDFEYDGEMQASIALDGDLMRQLYPFCRLSGPANVLIMPALHSANISAKVLQKIGGGTLIGPLLIGLSKPAQVGTAPDRAQQAGTGRAPRRDGQRPGDRGRAGRP